MDTVILLEFWLCRKTDIYCELTPYTINVYIHTVFSQLYCSWLIVFLNIHNISGLSELENNIFQRNLFYSPLCRCMPPLAWAWNAAGASLLPFACLSYASSPTILYHRRAFPVGFLGCYRIIWAMFQKEKSGNLNRPSTENSRSINSNSINGSLYRSTAYLIICTVWYCEKLFRA